MTFVCGWVLQVLVGSWLYLLPVGRPGEPGERRVWSTAMEIGANAQVVVGNLGLALLALALAGLLPGRRRRSARGRRSRQPRRRS